MDRTVKAGIAIALLLLALAACSGDDTGDVIVGYEVSRAAGNAGGTECTADITYAGKDGAVQSSGQSLASTWSANTTVAEEDVEKFVAFIYAQDNCDTGSISAEIRKDGNLLQQDSTSSSNDSVFLSVSLE